MLYMIDVHIFNLEKVHAPTFALKSFLRIICERLMSFVTNNIAIFRCIYSCVRVVVICIDHFAIF